MLACSHCRYEGDVIINTSSKDSTILSSIFQAGFVLNCFCVTFEGRSNHVKNVLAWLPVLSTVVKVKLYLLGSKHVPCLHEIARVFPNLQIFSVKGESGVEGDPGLSQHALKPLAECPNLSCLLLLLPLKLTTLGLARLCATWPLLEVLQYLPFEGVDDNELEHRLQVTNPMAEIRWD